MAPLVIYNSMHDIGDLLSGPLHIERIVFGCESTHVYHQPAYREEKRMRYYVGAISDDRFLLVEIPSPETANEPVDFLQFDMHAAMVARTSDTDFYYSGPLITPEPRCESSAPLENAFRLQLSPLWQCLKLGISMAKPGSFRWDGDHFNADYTDEIREQQGVMYPVTFGKPGEVVPESVKEKFLADLENPPANLKVTTKSVITHKVTKMIGLDGKVIWSSDGNLEPVPPDVEPAPGSVEARIAAHYKATHEARMAKGVNGELLRDAQGSVSEIRFDDGIHRVEFDYAPSDDLPLPWPHRIRTFINSVGSEPEVPSSHMTIYAARISDQPLDDTAFIPWPYLKEGTYVRGQVLPNGHFKPADPKDQILCHKLVTLHNLRCRRAASLS
jgi:hypothetical protein